MGDRENAPIADVLVPGYPYIAALKEGAQKPETFFKAADRSLLILQLQVEFFKVVAGNGDGSRGMFGVRRQDQKIVGIANQLEPCLFECQVEVSKKQIRQQGRNRRTLWGPAIPFN